MRHILRISLAHFAEHRLRTALTLVGIAAGVTAVVATTILSDSIYQSFENLVTMTAGDAELHVSNGAVGVPEDLIEALHGVRAVDEVSAVVEGFVPIRDDPATLLAVFGLDVLGDGSWRKHLPRRAVEVPDELEFVVNPDSIVVTREYGRRAGLRIGSTIEVISPQGPATLTVRGFVDDAGLGRLYGGRLAVMDLPAAQALLQRPRRVDRIDLHLRAGAPAAQVSRDVERVVAGRGTVREPAAHGRRALDLLLTIRVMLGQAVVMSIIVGFLIIYHTMSVSIMQRHREIALLRSLGATRRLVLAWVAAEATVLGLVASAFGFVVAVGLGTVAVRMFGPVTDSWIRLSPLPPRVSWEAGALSVAIGVGVSVLATLWAGLRVLRRPPQHGRDAAAASGAYRPRTVSAGFLTAVAAAAFLVVAVMPVRLSSFAPVMAYNSICVLLLFVSFTLGSSIPALWAGRAGVALAKTRPGIGVLFASAAISRNPTAARAVIAAIVIALGWSVGNASYMASVRGTWLGWVAREYPPGMILVTTRTGITGLNAIPFAESILERVRRMEGVSWVEGIRIVEGELRGRPIVIQARDAPQKAPRLTTGDWQRVRPAFVGGDAVLLSANLGRTTGLDVGDTVTLQSTSGPATFPVAGLVDDDVEGGDLGSVIISRARYRELWADEKLNRLRVTVADRRDHERVGARINEEFAETHGVAALSAEQYRQIFAELIDGAFAGAYALVFVGFTVSFIAVVNFLLAMLVERRIWYQRLHVLSATGAQIRRSVFAEGGLLGVIGAAVGVAAAVAFSLLTTFRSIPLVNGWYFDYTFPIGPAVLGVIGTTLLAFGAAVVPGRMASRRDYLLEVTEE